MHAHSSPEHFPRGALMAAGALLALTILGAGAARLLHYNASPLPAAQAVTVLHLVFRDRADGAVEVLDADRDGAMRHVFEPGTQGFVRGVLRGMARARRAAGVGAAPPFTLTRWSDGRMTLQDPETGQRISLEVFGPANSLPFAELLSPSEPTTRN
jgi:putative photosynthetic complex assembly protein